MRTKEDAKGVIEKSLRDKFTLLFLNSTKISEKLMKTKKEDKIKGVDLFFKITRNFTYCCKNNIFVFGNVEITQEGMNKRIMELIKSGKLSTLPK